MCRKERGQVHFLVTEEVNLTPFLKPSTTETSSQFQPSPAAQVTTSTNPGN